VQGVNLLVSGGHRFSDLEFDLTGPNLAKLEAYSRQVMEGLKETPGLVDIDNTLSVRQPELQVQIQREKASSFGINVRDIASALRTLIGGEPISTYREEQEQIDVWLRAQLQDRVREAISLERAAMAGFVRSGDEVDALVGELGACLRAVLRDVLCGHLDPALRRVADELRVVEEPA